MKESEKKHIPELKKQGWSAREIIEQGANEESDEVVKKILHGDEEKGNEEKRSLIDILFPPNRNQGSGRLKRELSVLRSQLVNSAGEKQ